MYAQRQQNAYGVLKEAWGGGVGYDLHGAAYVVNNQLGMTHIWDRVRVMGGAYGGFCSFDSHSGLFQYLSYRCAPQLCGAFLC